MRNIDFLPDIYRQRETMRQARVWWCSVVLIFSTAIGMATLAQFWMRRGIQAQLDELAPRFAASQRDIRELADLQTQINVAGRQASLFTFLEDRWPRTQILAEIVRPVPSSVRLTQVHIGEVDVGRAAGPQSGPRRNKPAKEEDQGPALAPPEQDLHRLRNEGEQRATVVTLEGHTTEVALLHQYVAEIGSSSLFESAEIKSHEAAPEEKLGTKTIFVLRVVVRPGHAADPPPGNAQTDKRLALGGEQP